MLKSLIQNSIPTSRRRRRKGSQRKGGAVVEAALLIPFIILLMMGTLEVCAGIYLQDGLTVCAFEGVRVGVRRRGTADQVRQRALEALADRNIVLNEENGEPVGITIEPSDFGDLSELDPIRVTITAPTTGNSLYIFDSFLNRNITASVTMVREFDE